MHRIVILKEGTNHAVGILSQLRLVKFLWENGRSFPIIDELYSKEIRELGIGAHSPFTIKYVVLHAMSKRLRLQLTLWATVVTSL